MNSCLCLTLSLQITSVVVTNICRVECINRINIYLIHSYIITYSLINLYTSLQRFFLCFFFLLFTGCLCLWSVKQLPMQFSVALFQPAVRENVWNKEVGWFVFCFWINSFYLKMIFFYFCILVEFYKLNGKYIR